ncbi:MAG: SAM-dependent methyltransferase [Idiomarina sp. T82-3]|uniref:methyltransferase domain-containing protein n=1 Tax=Idiomarina TaxID=135575 RepID=UPI0007980B7A|nr:methyltransferase domain-containing protein [Idiomarina sp. T82-3]KXS34655.1 MAG: SAM-dependent methyltransferase [Idiomarina sp. T82-3]MAF75300.1 SAM-dependent methyltransferase [Idiomarinaceae bacterium]
MNKKQARGDFTGISQKFARNIYGSTKGRLRMAVLKRDLAPFIDGPKRTILDVGAGLGQVNEWFLTKGHAVIHTDIAADMVEEAQQNHEQLGLTRRAQYIVAPLEALTAQLPDQQFSLVLCHAVLEWVEDGEQAIQCLSQLLKPGGTLSLMFYNRDAQLMANAVYGNFDYIARGLKVKKTVRLSPQQPRRPQDVEKWLTEAGLQVDTKTGVRCFHDYLREVEHQQRYDELLDLEMEYNQQSPFRELGRYQHWLIRKPDK